jgi:hypothetical protein
MVEKPKAKKIVALKVYKGVEMLQKPDGSVHNETQYIRTEHGTNEWGCLMKFLNSSGYCKVVVEDVYLLDGEKPDSYEIDLIKKEVEGAFSFNTTQELTPEQKKIQELEAKLNSLIDSGNDEKTNIQKLRSEYYELAGKRCSTRWDEQTLEQKIQELKA